MDYFFIILSILGFFIFALVKLTVRGIVAIQRKDYDKAVLYLILPFLALIIPLLASIPSATPTPKAVSGYPTSGQVLEASALPIGEIEQVNTPVLLDRPTEQINTPRPFATRTVYYPFSDPDCAGSRLRVGDRAVIHKGGSRNGIRSTADTHPSNNIIGYADPGDYLKIIGGPVCNWNWILWEVQLEKDGLIGWTPETDGKEFWIDLAQE